ncbi:3-ketoacyl-CoA thiolase 2, peroxisomal isoform 2 [Corchorus olitorius]|uniref:3-ketoacyl-CoA thiolase 2, peroxisomal isoform 2 n=1 Tax=Corchorus olitorius TaxID=93759 RepID=A0A1R3HC06_9ROSI|nr:3-ketoacyl-CoA thiolase 2, peroxisomal isoform 2 [Corchorus olitorius]
MKFLNLQSIKDFKLHVGIQLERQISISLLQNVSLDATLQEIKASYRKLTHKQCGFKDTYPDDLLAPLQSTYLLFLVPAYLL